MKTRASTERIQPPKTTGLHTPATVLHVEDDANDVELLRAAGVKAGVPFTWQTVESGEQAMAYLNGNGPYWDRQSYPFPSLVLLDLKMPRTGGFDLLQWMRSKPELRELGVVVFSGSELQDDIQRAYVAGANAYVVKPIGFDALVQMLRDLTQSWFVGPQNTVAAKCAPLSSAGQQPLGRLASP